MSKPESMSAAVIRVIDEYPVGHQFYGNQLKDDVVKIFPDARNMYPDTLLRMARRHRRGAYRVVNRNESLYEKGNVKSIIEQINEVAPKEETPVRQSRQVKQGELSFFSQVFLTAFFVVFLGTIFALDSGYGRPLLPPSLMASKSASMYKPAEPMYLNGTRLFLLRRIFTAAVEVPNRCAISNIVIASILLINREKNEKNQVVIDKMLHHCNFLLYNRIVVLTKFPKFHKKYLQNLDDSLCNEYIIIMLQHCNNKKMAPV